MDTTQDPLRTTVPKSAQHAIPRRNTDPTRIFVERDRLARLWFLAALIVLIAAALDRYHLIATLKQREHVVIVDPAGTFYVSPLLKFEKANELHAQQSTLATIAFLERNPKDFDHPELLRQMFLKLALEKARSQQSGEAAEFKAKQLHQKAEVSRIDLLETRADAVLTQVTGQLIRSGIFQDKAFSEAIAFTLKLKMRRNPNMVENGRFPTAIQDFKYEISH
jgi:hypothetical protein